MQLNPGMKFTRKQCQNSKPYFKDVPERAKLWGIVGDEELEESVIEEFQG